MCYKNKIDLDKQVCVVCDGKYELFYKVQIDMIWQRWKVVSFGKQLWNHIN